MSASVSKPHRPCTEYNIFFQLERAYILQILLHSDPSVEASEVFHPSQPTYAGLPSLPHRYASLTLPYDWHLPGKEQRRKRKHRKSHGVISFHDLSHKIASAWKGVEEGIKSYCAQVCAVGMVRYKGAMKEWKRCGGQNKEKAVEPSTKSRSRTKPKPASPKKSEEMKLNKNIVKRKLKVDVPSNKNENTLLKVLPQDISIKDVSQVEEVVSAAPAPVLSEVFTMEEMDQAFENDIVFMGQEVTLDAGTMWDTQVSLKLETPDLALSSTDTSANVLSSTNNMADNIQSSQSTPFLLKENSQDEQSNKASRNPSVVSHEPVDMDDNEIINMWNDNGMIASNQQYQYRHAASPVLSNTNAATTITYPDVVRNHEGSNISTNTNLPHQQQQNSMFSLNGYDSTVRDNMQRMKSMLEQQMARWDNPEPLVRRNSLVACSA